MSQKKQENLYRFVGAKIICGGYGAGERLPSLREIFIKQLDAARHL